MPYHYKVTQDGVQIDTTVCPPRILFRIFPAFNGEPCTASPDGFEVIFQEKQNWVQVGAWDVTETQLDTTG